MTTHIVPPPLSPTSDQLVQPVIVSVPAALGSVQVLVQHMSWGIEVSVRPTGSGSWTPAEMVGVGVEARSA